MAQSIEKAKRNQTINRNDATNESTPSYGDENRSRGRTTAGDFSVGEMDSKTFKRTIEE